MFSHYSWSDIIALSYPRLLEKIVSEKVNKEEMLEERFRERKIRMVDLF